ncbi:MAG: FxsA family protein [Thioalkalispiraceae bacterium]|jgi:UPF0716 protein FxsA
MRIMPILLALFILTPLIEIYLFIKVGGVIGAFQTILLILVTAVIGIALLRHQGISTMRKVQNQMQQGELPAVEMLEGMMLFFAGMLLLTPGFFTDSIGFLLLIPPLRKALALWLLERSGTIVKIYPHPRESQHGGKYIDGDYDRHDD